ncbi:MAG: MgtC/SapB family protein [Anaerolineales bacterium]
MDTLYPQLLMLGKVIFSSILAGVVGYEREVADKPAGLRTHMLVGATATFLVTLALRAISLFKDHPSLRFDPSRIFEAIVLGVSFLGAGTILKNMRRGEETVEGLTTSASILSVAAVGIAVGFDAYFLAAGVTLWNLFVNWGLNLMVKYFERKSES